MFGAKYALVYIVLYILLNCISCELSLHDLETQDVDSRKYKYEKLKEHFPNKYKPIPFK